jgi:cytidylate kinase
MTAAGYGNLSRERSLSRKIITIDGPAGAGKSTISKMLAEKIGFEYLDTGALYRAISLCLSRESIPPIEDEKLVDALQNCRIRLLCGKVLLGDEDVSEWIRSQEVDRIVSGYSALPAVRSFLLKLQRAQVENRDIVADGRDMGSVVFPDAEVRIYLDADPEIRAARRWKELAARGIDVTFNEIRREIVERDRLDMERKISPLKIPIGARIVETSDMSVESVLETIMAILVESRVIGTVQERSERT